MKSGVRLNPHGTLMRQQSYYNRTKPPKTSDEIMLLLLTATPYLLLTATPHLLLTTIYHLLLTSGMSHALSLIKSCARGTDVVRRVRSCRLLGPGHHAGGRWAGIGGMMALSPRARH